MESNKRKIRTYNKMWKIEQKIYAIYNLVLPAPVEPKQLLYFFIIAGIVLFLSTLIPIVKFIPSPLRYIVIPIAGSIFLLRYKHDGRPPHKYFISLVAYLFTRGQYTERFQTLHHTHDEKIKIRWWITRGPAELSMRHKQKGEKNV